MALTRSFPTQHASGLPITDTRRVTAGLVVRNADGTPRAGVFPAHTNPLVTGRSTAPLMAYDVAPFLAATSRINTGVELIANDASTTVATTAAPASNSRIDVIWVRSQFVQHADANNDVVFGVTQGTPALTPVKPTIPAGALELATAEVLSTTTQTSTVVITQTHPYTAAAGGTVWVRNQTEMDAFAAAVNTKVLRLDTGIEWDRTSSGWRPADTGWVAVTTFGSGWSNLPGAAVRVRRVGREVFLEGALNLGGGAQWANLLTVPAEFKPGRNTYTGTLNTDRSGVFALGVVNTAGLVYAEANTGTSAIPMYVPLHMSWFID